LLVEGVSAVAVCGEIKKLIRREFKVCAFENAVHAPEDEAECASNASLLFGHGAAAFAPERALPGWADCGQFGRAAKVSDAEVAELADRIWTERLGGTWSDVFATHNAQGTHMLVLQPGDPNSIDFGLSAEPVPVV
jgi:hypothetical protein